MFGEVSQPPFFRRIILRAGIDQNADGDGTRPGNGFGDNPDSIMEINAVRQRITQKAKMQKQKGASKL